MELFISILLILIIISLFAFYLSSSFINSPTKLYPNPLSFYDEQKHNKSKDIKQKTKSTNKSSPKPTLMSDNLHKKKPQNHSIDDKMQTKVSKPTPAKLSRDKPVISRFPVVSEFIDENEIESKEWIPVDSKRKSKLQQKDKLAHAAKEPVVNIKNNINSNDTTDKVSVKLVKSNPDEQVEIKTKMSTNIKQDKSASNKTYEILKMERDAFLAQTNLLTLEVGELSTKLSESNKTIESLNKQLSSGTVSIQNLSQSSFKKSENLDKIKILEGKLLEAQKEIEVLKNSNTPNKIQTPIDSVIESTLQSEISRLAREITIAKQKNDSMQARLDYAERELELFKNQSKQNGILSNDEIQNLPLPTTTLHPQIQNSKQKPQKLNNKEKMFHDANKRLYETQNLLKESKTVHEKEIKNLVDRLDASDEVCRHNFSQLEHYKSQLDKLNSTNIELESEISNLRRKSQNFSEMESRIRALNDEKKILENQFQEEFKKRQFLSEELKKTAIITGSQNSQSSKLDLIAKECSLPKSFNNGYASENGFSDNDELYALTLENKHYKDLLKQTESTLCALQNSVIQEQTIWKEKLYKEEQLKKQEMSKYSKLMEEINKLRGTIKLEREKNNCEQKISEELRSHIRKLTTH